MRVALRQIAEVEVDAAVSYYLQKAGKRVAGEFLDQLKTTLKNIAEFPETGSLKYKHFYPDIDLRFCSVRHFPYAVFYVVEADFVDVIAVLHHHRDIPALLSDSFQSD